MNRTNMVSVFSFTKRDDLKSITEAYNIVEYTLRYKLDRIKVFEMFDRVKHTYKLLYKIQIRMKN